MRFSAYIIQDMISTGKIIAGPKFRYLLINFRGRLDEMDEIERTTHDHY
jgi:hypothetical protein